MNIGDFFFYSAAVFAGAFLLSSLLAGIIGTLAVILDALAGEEKT